MPNAMGRMASNYLRQHPVVAISTFGRQMGMGVRAGRSLTSDIVHRTFPFSEFIRQCAFMASTSVIPTLLVAIPFGVIVSVQVGAIAGQVGATSFAGAANGLGIIRQGAPLVTALLMAGAVGSAVCADLGSRTIRDEIDAMEVMAISPLQRLVVPRLAAAMLVSVLLCGSVCFVGFITGYMFNVFVQSGTPGSYLGTFAAFATIGDLVLALIKSVVFGAIVAIVACDKGLTTRGGPGGVANSVNAAVVISVILLFAVNVLFTRLYTIVFPARLI
ncbi:MULTISPECIES: ABC transporter permease [unclassified Rhodococcus (in: high G+C Gram-positive bacteria)]|uniref:MlaE family ABC transporter permease n=1 Tax=unclassified Rhodococcus (in: high G+C Gram-positive bacteria) TaxID=192944 RepID=UPI000ADAD8B5